MALVLSGAASKYSTLIVFSSPEVVIVFLGRMNFVTGPFI